MWTQFWDMHSGGGLKEKWHYIYIEAPEDEAIIIFYNRFGHNPHRVSCTCCGADYFIGENESLAQLTGYHRGCRPLKTPQYKSGKRKGLYKQPKDPAFKQHYYLEENEKPPKGYEVDGRPRFEKYQTLNQYKQRKDVLIISARKIKAAERKGAVPEQGYVTKWQE